MHTYVWRVRTRWCNDARSQSFNKGALAGLLVCPGLSPCTVALLLVTECRSVPQAGPHQLYQLHRYLYLGLQARDP